MPLGALNTGRYVKTCSGHGAVDQLVHKPLTAFQVHPPLGRVLHATQYYMGVLHGINTMVPVPTMYEYGDGYYPEQGADVPLY